MTYINVLLKTGQLVPVPNAKTAEWQNEPQFERSKFSVVRLVCKQGDNVLARFNESDVVGYVQREGTAPAAAIIGNPSSS